MAPLTDRASGLKADSAWITARTSSGRTPCARRVLLDHVVVGGGAAAERGPGRPEAAGVDDGEGARRSLLRAGRTAPCCPTCRATRRSVRWPGTGASASKARHDQDDGRESWTAFGVAGRSDVPHLLERQGQCRSGSTTYGTEGPASVPKRNAFARTVMPQASSFCNTSGTAFSSSSIFDGVLAPRLRRNPAGPLRRRRRLARARGRCVPAWSAAGEVLGDRDHHGHLAVGVRRQHHDAAAAAARAASRTSPRSAAFSRPSARCARDLDARRPATGASASADPAAATERQLHLQLIDLPAPAAWRPPAAAGSSRRSAPASCSACGAVRRAWRAAPGCARWLGAGERLDAPHARRHAASSTTTNVPMSPVARTCVPPHSSTLKPGTDTTRTRSPYFSPNSAMAPAAIASSVDRTSVCTGVFRTICSLTMRLDLVDLVARHRREVHEVEAQPIGRDQRARLLDVRAEHLPQRGVQQVGGGVVAAGRVADRRRSTSRGDDLPAPQAPAARRGPGAAAAVPPAAGPCARRVASPSAPTSRPVSDTWPPAST